MASSMGVECECISSWHNPAQAHAHTPPTTMRMFSRTDSTLFSKGCTRRRLWGSARVTTVFWISSGLCGVDVDGSGRGWWCGQGRGQRCGWRQQPVGWCVAHEQLLLPVRFLLRKQHICARCERCPARPPPLSPLLPTHQMRPKQASLLPSWPGFRRPCSSRASLPLLPILNAGHHLGVKEMGRGIEGLNVFA